jgi:hypothetical protein
MAGICDVIREITRERLRRRVVCDAMSCADMVGSKKWMQVDTESHRWRRSFRRMSTLISLPQELIMHTIVAYLGLNDSIRFIQVCAITTAHKIHLIYFLQTCKTLYQYTGIKAFWIHLVKCALRLRPIPLSEDWSRHSVEEIRDRVKSACQLTRMMGQQSLPPPKKIFTLEAQGSEGLTRAWLLRDGTHLITVSDDYIWRLWNIHSKEVLANIQLEGEISCCDWTQKPDALTVIINNYNENNESAGFGYSLHR